MALLRSKSIQALPHHKKDEICPSRATYRDGRKDTAVKVYTVNQESAYLLIQGVPAVGAQDDLLALCEQYGEIDFIQPLDEYPCEEFTEVYVVKYHWFPAARTAKKHLDDHSFFGGVLHVCYAPEFETVSDTRQKLQERRKYVAWKTKSSGPSTRTAEAESAAAVVKSNTNRFSPVQPKASTMINTSHNKNVSLCEPVTYIWAGQEYTVFPQSLENSSITDQGNQSPSGALPNIQQTNSFSQPFLPRQLNPATRKTTSEVHTKGSTGSAPNSYGSDNSERQLPSGTPSGPVNHSSGDNYYFSSAESIKKKLLNVGVPNVRVSYKRKKRI